MSVEPTVEGIPERRVCTECRNYRMKAHIALFDANDLQSPGALAAQTKWDEQQRQRAQEEQQRYVAKLPFESEPQHYAWCASYTMIDDVEAARAGDKEAQARVNAAKAATFNPVTGELSPLYFLCAWMNPESRCERYQPKS
jgi:hypothetical protein